MAQRRVNREGGQALLLLVGGLGRCSWARSCWARSRAAWESRAPISGRPTSARWPARGRCAPSTTGCSSRRRSAGAEPAASGSARLPARSGARRRGRRRARNGARTWRVTSRTRRDRARTDPRAVSRSGRRDRGRPRERGRRSARAPRPSSRARRRPGGFAQRRRLRRAAGLPPGQADAPGRARRLRPPGRRRRAPTASRCIDHQRLPLATPSRRSCSPRHPDPKWVAPPGHSLHRLGTELDLGPPRRLRLAGRERDAASASSSATRGSPGTSATR